MWDINLTVMTLLNLNHVWIMQAAWCLKGTFVKAKFHVCYHFFRMLREKTLLTHAVPSFLK